MLVAIHLALTPLTFLGFLKPLLHSKSVRFVHHESALFKDLRHQVASSLQLDPTA